MDPRMLLDRRLTEAKRQLCPGPVRWDQHHPVGVVRGRPEPESSVATEVLVSPVVRLMDLGEVVL